MTQVRSLASLSRLRIMSCGIGHRRAWIWRCLSCGVSQWPQLRFLGISICHECGPQKKKKKKKSGVFLWNRGLTMQWFGSLLWQEFNPWPRNFQMSLVRQKTNKPKTIDIVSHLFHFPNISFISTFLYDGAP